jgi:hypothetical protein
MKVFLVISLAFLSVRGEALWQCPAGHRCLHHANATALFEIEQCKPGSYSMEGWEECCGLSLALACGKQTPGHFALDSKCRCNRVSCDDDDTDNKNIMRGLPGRFVCEYPQPSCQPCPSTTMMRERHTCTCLSLSYPCLSNEVLWGNKGGPYLCLALALQKIT